MRSELVFSSLLIFGLCTQSAWSCLGAGGPEAPSSEAPGDSGNGDGGDGGDVDPPPQVTIPPPVTEPPLPASDVISRLVGDGVNTFTYDPAGYNSRAGGPVDEEDELRCDFDGISCCWANAQPPLDQLEWQLASGVPEQRKMHENFGPFGPLDVPPPIPSGKYLLVGVTGGAASDEAQFVSCSVSCSQDEIIVRARHWTTENTLLQVCTRASFFDNPSDAPLLNCQELPRSNSPGPTEIVLPPNSLVDVRSACVEPSERGAWQIVFVASNMVGDSGDAAILDDIEVEFDLCEEEPATALPPRGTDCEQTKCDFEAGDACGYTDAGSSGSLPGFNKAFETVQGEYENKITGIAEAEDGGTYIATYLFPGDKAALETNVELQENRVIRFLHYEATSGIQMKGCCDAADNCPFITDADVTVADRQWRSTSFVCPSGSTKIIFVCENTQNNQGACALDAIEMFVLPENGQPDEATDPVC